MPKGDCFIQCACLCVWLHYPVRPQPNLCPLLAADCALTGCCCHLACDRAVVIFPPDKSASRVSITGLARLLSTPRLGLVLTFLTTLQSVAPSYLFILPQLMQIDDRPSPLRVSLERPGNPQGSAILGCCLFSLPRRPLIRADPFPTPYFGFRSSPWSSVHSVLNETSKPASKT